MSDRTAADDAKLRNIVNDPGSSGFTKYRALCYGDTSLGHVLWGEFVQFLVGGMPGAAGIFLRSKLYPSLFASCGKGVLFGRNVTLRHPRKIRLGDGVIVDDNCVLDAKGTDNRGIILAGGVYIGRNSIVYCKGGNITMEERVSISSSCTVFSSNDLTIREGTVTGAYSYLLSGGEYDYHDTATPFCKQDGMTTRGPLSIGRDCWLGARVTVLDGASIGNGCVIGAGAVVTGPIPDGSLAVGVPARIMGQTGRTGTQTS
jgi:acetyltransferase-like isoleucine patch superfamily enzyme